MKLGMVILALCTVSAFAQTSVQAKAKRAQFEPKYRALRSKVDAEKDPVKKGALRQQLYAAKVQRWELGMQAIKAEDAEERAAQWAKLKAGK